MRAALLSLALAGCTPPTPVQPPTGFASPMRMVGTEPFWGARIAAEGITLSGADRAERRWAAVDPVVTRAGARWSAPGAEFTIVREPCSDGMSDRSYPFAAEVAVGGETLRGCAAPEADFAR